MSNPRARVLLLSALALAPAARADAPALTGRWVVAVDRLGVTDYYNVRLVQNGDQLSGDFDGDPVTGTVRDGAIAFLGKDSQGGFEDVRATLVNGALTAREKSLIALAVAHAVQCAYCIDAYTTDCLEKGADLEQMTEALHVAVAIRGGASLVHGMQMVDKAASVGM